MRRQASEPQLGRPRSLWKSDERDSFIKEKTGTQHQPLHINISDGAKITAAAEMKREAAIPFYVFRKRGRTKSSRVSFPDARRHADLKVVFLPVSEMETCWFGRRGERTD